MIVDIMEARPGLYFCAAWCERENLVRTRGNFCGPCSWEGLYYGLEKRGRQMSKKDWKAAMKMLCFELTDYVTYTPPTRN